MAHVSIATTASISGGHDRGDRVHDRGRPHATASLSTLKPGRVIESRYIVVLRTLACGAVCQLIEAASGRRAPGWAAYHLQIGA